MRCKDTTFFDFWRLFGDFFVVNCNLMKFFATNAVFQNIIYHCINTSKWLFYKFIVVGEITLFYSRSEYANPI